MNQILTNRPLPGAQLNFAHPLVKGLVGCWLLNEQGGLIANDLSGYGNHGVLTSFPSPPPSKFNGLPFDGTNDKIVVAAKGIFQDLTNCAVEFWCRPAVNFLTAYRKLINSTDAENSFNLVTYSATGEFAVFPVPVASTTLAMAGTIYHVVATKVGTAFNLYINGILEGTGAGSIPVAARGWHIGCNAAGDSQFWKGDIFLARLWRDRSLNKDNVRWLFAEPYDMFLR